MLFAKLDNGACPKYIMALRLVNNNGVLWRQQQNLLLVSLTFQMDEIT